MNETAASNASIDNDVDTSLNNAPRDASVAPVPTIDLTETTWRTHGTTFDIHKLLPMQAFHCLELARVSIGSQMKDIDIDALMGGDAGDAANVAQTGKQLITVLMQTSPKVVNELQRRMFTQVFYTNRLADTPRVVYENEAEAFVDCTPVDIYQLTVRAFAVNFFDCFGELMSLMSAATPDSASPNTRT